MRKARNSKRLVTIDRACSYGGISRPTAYRLIKAGTLHKFKLRHHTYLSLKEIDRWRRSLVPHPVD